MFRVMSTVCDGDSEDLNNIRIPAQHAALQHAAFASTALIYTPLSELTHPITQSRCWNFGHDADLMHVLV